MVEAIVDEKAVEHHFWVASSEFFETSLFLSSKRSQSVDEEEAAKSRNVSLELFDADGQLVNTLTLALAPGVIESFELREFLGSCKLESGMKHAHLVVKSDDRLRAYCRLRTEQGATFAGAAELLSRSKSCFFPLRLGGSRVSLVTLVNQSDDVAQVRCRLMVGSRTPSRTISLKARASKVFSVQAEFPEYAFSPESKEFQGYVRLGTIGGEHIGVQMIEHCEGSDIYSMVV